jgi:hypothetical protein
MDIAIIYMFASTHNNIRFVEYSLRPVSYVSNVADVSEFSIL